MSFPNLHTFPECLPDPYERLMGQYIAQFLSLFTGRLPDTESHAAISELARTQSRWTAAHVFFDEIRLRRLKAEDQGESRRVTQYYFEECCCQALYNATYPDDPFDQCSPFFVLVAGLELAKLVGLPLDQLADVAAAPPDGGPAVW